ncbi:hypothetical protein [Pseudalkalibacillus berkeleyi]|uniref:Uncharacterized protein n=1 Tax=Pseudalkalibacillus berkeleyi TaxID=1069813 RepID=A0ABS9H0U5_9BACL|nr:hypothetical protein [Pseudalkalibacillus berkeleyi]MCF6137393.1 hypothetical protein [Pseudalkalibacillus berkeleyi]
MESIVIRSFHNDEVRFAFVYNGRLYTMMMNWSLEQNHWNLHTYDQELLKDPDQHGFIVNQLLSNYRVKEFFKEKNISHDQIFCKDCENVTVE